MYKYILYYSVNNNNRVKAPLPTLCTRDSSRNPQKIIIFADIRIGNGILFVLEQKYVLMY